MKPEGALLQRGLRLAEWVRGAAWLVSRGWLPRGISPLPHSLVSATFDHPTGGCVVLDASEYQVSLHPESCIGSAAMDATGEVMKAAQSRPAPWQARSTAASDCPIGVELAKGGG